MSDLQTFLGGERGRAARMARALKRSPAFVQQLCSGKRHVPAEHCPVIERESEGAVTCERLRADIEWHRVPDSTWPWHREGRPLWDLAKRIARATNAERG